jgi:hypothetical protein
MNKSELIYKSNIRYFGNSFSLVSLLTLFFFSFFIFINELIINDFKIIFYILNTLIFIFLLWLLIATEIRFFYIFDDHVEIYHPLYIKKFKWLIIKNQEIKGLILRNSIDGSEIVITSNKRRSFLVNEIEDKKKILNHFYKLNIPIKIYSQAEEDQHLIER